MDKTYKDYKITKDDILKKGHFCPEWDFDYIEEGYKEFESCSCFFDFRPENQGIEVTLRAKRA